MGKPFYKFVKAEAGNELILDGVIASESWYEDEISPKMFRDELAKYPGDLTVRINSPGGDVSAGVAIYNMLNEHEGYVTVKVDGLAASIASLIAMAGDKIIMLPGSMMMVHLPWTIAGGNADDMEQVVEMLKKTGESLIPIYAARTGLSEERIEELLRAETWMTAQDAVELGFADEAEGAKTTLAEAMAKISELTNSMQSAVMQPVMSLKAKTEVEDDTNTTDTPAEVDEEKSETTDAEEAEVAEEVTEETPVNIGTVVVDVKLKDDPKDIADQILNELNKETEMSEVKEIAKDQILPEAQAKVDAPVVSVKDYLNTKESMEAFARILEENPAADHNDEGASQRVRAAWKKHLETKMGVTNPEILLPTPLIQEIEDAFKAGGEIWQRVSKTGMDSFNAAWDANTDSSAESGRAKGYNREDEEEKAEQELTINNRILRPQMVYKYITLNREDVKEQRSTGALVRFVLSELPRRIIREIERAIILGDGRAAGSDYKIQEGNPRGFYPVVADAVAQNVFADIYTPTVDDDNYSAVVRAADLLEAEGRPVLIAKKGFVTDMKLATNANGGYIFPLGADFASILGVAAIVEPDWFNDTTSPDINAVLVVLENYRVVGDQSVEAFTNFLLKTNKQEYLQEIWAGGGLTFRKSAVAIGEAASS